MVLIIRLIIGGIAFLRGLFKVTPIGSGGISSTTDKFEYMGFTAPRVAVLTAATAQLLGGAMFLLGVAVPLAAGLVVAVALVALRVRPREGSVFTDLPSLIDLVLIAGSLTLAMTGPGEPAFERAVLDLEIANLTASAGVIATVVLAGLGAAGGLMMVDDNVAARNQSTGDEVDEDEALAGEIPSPETTPLEEAATDPAESTEGESVPNPISQMEGGDEDREQLGQADEAAEEAKADLRDREETPSPPPPPLDPSTATDPAENTEGESPTDPIKEEVDEDKRISEEPSSS